MNAMPTGRTRYALLHGTAAGLIINPLLVKKLPYDTFRDFAPVSMVVIVPQLLVVHPGVPAATLKDLIALAKASPGRLNYASVGVGSPNHLGMEREFCARRNPGCAGGENQQRYPQGAHCARPCAAAGQPGFGTGRQYAGGIRRVREGRPPALVARRQIHRVETRIILRDRARERGGVSGRWRSV